ncbi:nuclear polyadenylated RNA-binding protein 3-like [Chenopodium quinoa]|uniref:nuclear polyadenylated RNA-binding protein 3-like n=1 Tax=Chenopodium quinoa TaxID=63459 RepID=UPI000B77403D|nr:nuclear polyadenylated RNA-binding protein 3-like [Chenopodium quinoa]
MEKTSKELLQLEHKDPSSSFKESALLVCGKSKKSTEEKTNSEGKPFPAPLPKSQVLGKVKDFLGVISEANKTLQLNAKDKPEEFDIEVLHGNESEYIEMDLMLGVADLQTPEAMEAAEAAMAGNQPVVDLRTNDSSSESESSSDDEDDDDDDDEDDRDEDENVKADSMQVDGSSRQQSESRTKRKQPKIVVLP